MINEILLLKLLTFGLLLDRLHHVRHQAHTTGIHPVLLLVSNVLGSSEPVRRRGGVRDHLGPEFSTGFTGVVGFVDGAGELGGEEGDWDWMGET